jgi:DNA replication protein DnaC
VEVLTLKCEPGYCIDCGAELNFDIPVIMRINKAYCGKCIERMEKEEVEEEAKKAIETEEQKKRDRLFKYKTSVPPRYSGVKEIDNEELINATCSILYGGFGTGKTWEAYSLIKKLYCNLYIDDYKLITEAGLINYLKAGFNNNSFESRTNSLKDIDLLVVDEMGKSNDSDFNKAQLFEILNYRYDWMKKTVLICNCVDRSELVDILNPAIADRFRENIIEMKGNSKRYMAKGENR